MTYSRWLNVVRTYCVFRSAFPPIFRSIGKAQSWPVEISVEASLQWVNWAILGLRGIAHWSRDGTIPWLDHADGSEDVRDAFRLVRALKEIGVILGLEQPPGEHSADDAVIVLRRVQEALETTERLTEKPDDARMVTCNRIAGVVSCLNRTEPISPGRISELLREYGIKPDGKVGNAHAFRFDKIQTFLSSALGNREIPANYANFQEIESQLSKP